MHGLDLFFNRPSQIVILRVLFHAETGLTGREVERRSGLSNRAAMQCLEQLHDASIVDKEIVGNAHYYTLNSRNYLVNKALKPAFEAEELLWEDIRKTVRKIVHPRPTAAVATGPVVRDEGLSTGRLELTLLFSTGRSRIRAFQCIEELTETFWDKYAVQVDPVLIDPNRIEHESYEALWRRIEREGVLLFGVLP